MGDEYEYEYDGWNPAFVANIFNTFLSALSSVVIFTIVYSILKQLVGSTCNNNNNNNGNRRRRKIISTTTRRMIVIGGSLVASVHFSFSTLIWTYSTHLEVFGLNNLLVSLLLLMVQRFHEAKEFKYLEYGALIMAH